MNMNSEPASAINGEMIAARIDALAAFSDDPACLTRLTLSPAHKNAADLVMGWMRKAGMDAHFDAAGNVVGRCEGASPRGKTLIIGSHIDTVRNAGRFDGNLGVVAGIAVVDELNRRSIRLPFAIEVIAFSDEEGTRFSSTLSGSRALAGTFDISCLDDVDSDGVTRRQALADFGCKPEDAALLTRDPARTLAYLEVHIEQGPVLEAQDLPLGVVSAINGATRGEFILTGEAGHAGTLPMLMRRDALAAAAEMIMQIEMRACDDEQIVATIGRLEIPNSAVNIVPGKVFFSLDLRSSSDEVRRSAVSDIEAEISRIAAARGVSAQFAVTHDMPATTCAPHLAEAIGRAFVRNGHKPFPLASGAGHDGVSFRGRIPIGMIFVRCRGGVSHNPAEFASAADMGAAARVLFDLIQDAGAFV